MEGFVMFSTILTSGLALGAIYALVALGIVVVYKGTGVVNFAHGAVFTMAATLAYLLVSAGVAYFLSLFLALLLITALVVVVERIAFRRLIHTGDPLIFKGATIAFAFLLVGVVRFLVAREGEYVTLDPILGYAPVYVFGARIASQDLFIICAGTILLAVFVLFFYRTRYGRLMQAVAENINAARVIGIDISRIYLVIWGLGAILGGIGGLLMAPVTLIYPELGVLIFLKAVAAAILGGFDKLHGAVVGGLIVGLLEVVISFYIGTIYQEAVAFMIILIVLFLRPQGLFGSKAVVRV